MNPRKKALFLDRDGVINVDSGYVWRKEDLILREEIIPFLHLLKEKYIFIIITNQSGIARGMYQKEDVETFHQALIAKLAAAGIHILDIFFCPHHPKHGSYCLCRKPSPLMIEKAAAKHHIDLNHSWMIGDKITDVDAGLAAGCKTIFLSSGSYEKATYSGNALLEAIPLL
ncbi:MAG: HAD family hydrolase [Bacteroidota bacterium]